MKKLSCLLISLCIGLLSWSAIAQTNVSYDADNSTIFSNPERGFITMLENKVSESHPYVIKGSEETLDDKISSEKMSIILAHYYLDNYKDKETIPAKVLNAFDEDMQVLRSKGMKAIIRFSYTNTTYKKGGKESAADAPLNIVQKHIAQYKSHWQDNADVIFCFQAGIVGAWGEWYYTDNFGNKASTINDSRRALLDTLLKAVPKDRCIQIRTPLFKTGYIGDTNPLTAETAYRKDARSRLGHHNDAFLYGPYNMGTYEDTATQKPYIAQETLYVPIGGESDITDPDQADEDASPQKTIAEMSRLHWTFIQSGYSETVTNRWRANGTFDILNRLMGYRYQLVSGTYSNEVKQGSKLSINLQIKNVGYAPLYNERPAYIVLKNGNNVYPFKLAVDPRRWLPNGVVSTVDEQITIPTSVPLGTYDLYLSLPDAYATLANDPRYAIRFANTGNLWDAETGYNKLNAQVTIKEAGSTPDPDPQPGDAILLPATLNKANVTAYSEDMTWFNSDYFDFGPEDAENLDRWAEWKVELKYPVQYEMTALGYYPNGHEWQVELLNSGVDAFHFVRTWDEGDLTEHGTWNLSGVTPGEYTIRVKNVFDWSQPKLKSLKLECEEPICTSLESIENAPTSSVRAQKILRNGQLFILREGKMFTIQGTEVR